MTKSLSVVNQQQKLGEWAERVSACRNSGLSVRTLCRAQYQAFCDRQEELPLRQHAGRCSEQPVIFSLIQTSIENGLDPWRYLTWLIDAATKGDVDADGLFPWAAPDSCRVST